MGHNILRSIVTFFTNHDHSSAIATMSDNSTNEYNEIKKAAISLRKNIKEFSNQATKLVENARKEDNDESLCHR